MMNIMHEGGWAMWIILLFGGITMTAAVIFALRPEEGRLGFIRGMSTATVFTTLAGVASGFATTFHNVAQREEFHQYPDIVLAPMVGIGESLANAILGFSLLGIAWFIVAIGLRRLSATP